VTWRYLHRVAVFALSLSLGALTVAAPRRAVTPAAAPGAGAGQRPPARPQPSTSNPPGLPFTWEWWDDAGVKRDLGLTDEGAKAIEDLYAARLAEAQPWVDDYLRQREKLDRMTSERSASEASYGLQVSRVEALRSRLAESRMVMLYRIYKELSPEQYRKLLEIYKKLQQQREQRMHADDGRGRGASPAR
jgi:Spy/CpxP family protein refolding chaperone